jgi:vacuolar protein sorting-associated protein 13D
MDTVSGSLKDSEPTSPVSPVSPPSPMSSSYFKSGSGNTLTIPSQLHEALVSSLQGRKRKVLGSVGSQTPVVDNDVLITADVVLTHKEEELAIITVQFNNLDVIANQETMMEILQFLRRIFPSSSNASSQLPESKSSEQTLISGSGGRKVQANFEFHRLNVLLLRGVVGKDGNQVARKIATATASDARVNFSLSKFFKYLKIVDGFGL